MRFVLALCVIVGCTLCGSALAGVLRRRVKALESIAQGLKLLRLHMISMFEPLQQALKASGNAVLEALGEQMTPGVSAAEAWTEVKRAECRRGGRIDALSSEDLRTLDALFDQLGESGRDQQDVLLNGARAALDRNLEAARARMAESDRLYVSLGALTGLMIALIVI